MNNRRFHTYPDSDDWTDLAIGYPCDIAHEVEPEPDVAAVAQTRAPYRRHRNRSHFGPILDAARRIGADGVLFLACDVAAACGYMPNQVAKVLQYTKAARIVGMREKHNYWQIAEGQ